PPGETAERDFSWFDDAGLGRLSQDGRRLLFRDRFGIYLGGTDGSAPVKLGYEGEWVDDLSPDGRLVVATNRSADQLVLLPTGPGSARILPNYRIKYSGATWFPDGQRLLVNGREAGRRVRSYVIGLP